MKKIFRKTKIRLPRPISRRWTRLKRRYKIIIVVALVISGGFLFFKNQGSRRYYNSIEVSQVTKQTIERKILRSGTLEYKGINQNFSSSDGQITDLWVQNGDEVTKDQRLFKVRSSANKEEKAQAWSAYLSAKNALEKARQGNNQTQSSLESARQALLTAEQAVKDAEDHRGDYTDKEFEALEAAERAARFNLSLAESETTTVDDKISAAEADFQVAWLKYQATQDLTMLATTAGRIENLSISVGDIVTHTDQAPVLLIVSNPKQVVSVNIGEVDAALLKPNQPAQISVDAFPDQTFDAYVSRVDTVGTKTQEGVSYTAWLELREINSDLLSGMTADVEILIETRENVLAVPNQALQYRSSEYYLMFGGEDKNVKEERRVETGIRNDEFTQITSDVEEGQQILIIPR